MTLRFFYFVNEQDVVFIFGVCYLNIQVLCLTSKYIRFQCRTCNVFVKQSRTVFQKPLRNSFCFFRIRFQSSQTISSQ